ncbi:MAG: triose-phosphate isomerase [Deltaproteobacteria bacterium]|nr:triose-phosphate isomerase [Deltaproteobacteria bacterium]
MRRPVIAANWKMHKTVEEAQSFVSEFRRLVSPGADVEVVLAPPFTALQAVGQALAGTAIGLAGQDLFWEERGAYTGEVSAGMLQDVGCRYVIIGHSERRQHFGEGDATVNRKVQAALRHGLTPIVCVGESLDQREAGQTLAVIRAQVDGGLQGLQPDAVQGLIIAYEPVWAIGTGRTATPEQAQEVHAAIRGLLGERWSKSAAEAVRIQYGGSVRPDNIDELMARPDIDGALVGGASLKPDDFARIVQFKRKA